MTRRRLVTILAAVLLTLVGTLIIVTYVSSAERRAIEGQQRTTVLAANERIPAETPASDLTQLVHPMDVPVDLRPEDAIETLDEVADQVTVADLLPNEPLRLGQFEAPNAATAGPQDLPDELQIVSISLDAQRALGGRVQPGQVVGVMLSVDQAEVPNADNPDQTTQVDQSTGMILNRVPVTAVQGGVDAESGEGGGNTVTVSFAVDESDAERLVFGAEHGRLWLTEQNENTPTINGTFRSRQNILTDLDTGGQ